MLWLIRAAGTLLVFFAAAFLGLGEESRLKRRWMILRAMCEALRYLEKEMIYHRTPLEEALVSASVTEDGEVGAMLRAAAQKMKIRKGTAFQAIWQEAAEEALGDGGLSEAEFDTVADAWRAFCNPDVVLQKTMLEQQLLRTERLCREAEEAYREKAGLYRKLGAAGGIFLIILLL